MKVLLTGAGGQLGQALIAEHRSTDRARHDRRAAALAKHLLEARTRRRSRRQLVESIGDTFFTSGQRFVWILFGSDRYSYC